MLKKMGFKWNDIVGGIFIVIAIIGFFQIDFNDFANHIGQFLGVLIFAVLGFIFLAIKPKKRRK